MSPNEHRLRPSKDHYCVVAVIHADLRLHCCGSLKEKRGRLARAITALRKKHPVVVAEVGDHDVWGRAALAVAAISTDANLATRVLEAAADTLISLGDVELAWHEIEMR